MSVNKEKILADLFSRRRAGIKPGLKRIAAAANALGNPQKSFKSLHIAGTNGKGSTAAMAAAVFCENGWKTGLFTSPHLMSFAERFCINGHPVADDDWLAEWLAIRPVCDRYGLTFFEISTLLAFRLFEKHECDFAVIETGLGGRLDSTNIITPVGAVITSISRDHTDLLGNTIEEIAREKLGIVKRKVPFSLQKSNPRSVAEQALQRSVEMEAPLLEQERMEVCDIHERGLDICLGGTEYEIPLHGEFQAWNFQALLPHLKRMHIPSEVIRRGLAATRIAGRLQTITVGECTFIFDTSHNPAAAEGLAEGLKKNPHDMPSVILLGMMADKDYTGYIRVLADTGCSVAATDLPGPRGAAAEKLIKEVAPHLRDEVFPSVPAALENLGSRFPRIIVCGSFVTVGEAMKHLGISPAASQI
ncbi:MAG: bifunctional folylpolyglutamate synthase/dihydrofolate synthase [Fibrobacterota bacterium]